MFVSVIVRSYKRPEPLLELVARLRAQRHEPFEVVIVEQSNDPALVARLEALGDPRLRIFVRPPLGAAGARNEAIRQARGELLLLVDDDDLPIGEDWIAAHVANYADPACQGVVGRLCSRPDGKITTRFPRYTRWRALRHTFWKDTWGYCSGPLYKKDVDFLIGSNASVRRSLVERIGGWDEIPYAYGEEQSFAFRYQEGRQPGEYLAYDPTPVIWRRTDVPGGEERRVHADWWRRELEVRVAYYHDIVAHYHPWRFRLLYPLYLLRAPAQALGWIWDGDNAWHGARARLAATAGVFWRTPGAIRRARRRGQINRVKELTPGASR